MTTKNKTEELPHARFLSPGPEEIESRISILWELVSSLQRRIEATEKELKQLKERVWPVTTFFKEYK